MPVHLVSVMSSSSSRPQLTVPSPTPFCPSSSSSNKRKLRGTLTPVETAIFSIRARGSQREGVPRGPGPGHSALSPPSPAAPGLRALGGKMVKAEAAPTPGEQGGGVGLRLGGSEVQGELGQRE